MADTINRDPWFFCPSPGLDVKTRLFCLPFAGGGASVYRGWNNAFPENIDVWAVQLPGHESRINEPRISNTVILAKAIADALSPYLDKPFALFGYSIGALLAFEVSRELRRRGEHLPAHLFIAAMHAPHVPMVHPPLAHLPREEFLEQIDYYYQPSDDAWKIPELMEIFLPVLRDDISIADTYEYISEPPLSCPLDVYVGEEDRGTPLTDAEAWQDQTSAIFELTVFPGSHFFLHNALGELQKKVLIRMNKVIEKYN